MMQISGLARFVEPGNLAAFFLTFLQASWLRLSAVMQITQRIRHDWALKLRGYDAGESPSTGSRLSDGDTGDGEDICTWTRAAVACVKEGRTSELPRLMLRLPMQYRRTVANHTCPRSPDPLIVAAMTSRGLSAGEITRVVNFLLAECGADVNADKDGLSPLHFAVRSDNAGLVETLMDHGAECDVSWPGGTPLVYVPASLGSRPVTHALCVGLGAKHSPLVTSLCDDSAMTSATDEASVPLHVPRSARIVEVNCVELLGSFLVDTGEDTCQVFEEGLRLFSEAMRNRYLDPADVVFKNEDFGGRRLVLSCEEVVNLEELEKASQSEDIFEQSYLTLKRILGNPSLLFSALVGRADHFRKVAGGERSSFFYLRRASYILHDELSLPSSRQSWLFLTSTSSEDFVECLCWLLQKNCDDKLLWPIQATYLSFCCNLLDQTQSSMEFAEWAKTWQEGCFQVIRMVLSQWEENILPDRIRETLNELIQTEQRMHTSGCPSLLLCAVLDAAESEDIDVIKVLLDHCDDVSSAVDPDGNTALHRCLKLRPPQYRLASVLDVAWVIIQSGKVNPLILNAQGESVRDLLWELLSECARDEGNG